jgi:hypothetical protein
MEKARWVVVVLCLGFLGLCSALESPQFTVVHSESDFEIRLYRDSTWMSAPVKDISFDKATKLGFHRYLLYPCNRPPILTEKMINNQNFEVFFFFFFFFRVFGILCLSFLSLFFCYLLLYSLGQMRMFS